MDMQAGEWRQKIVDPDTVLAEIKPGMSIFIGTGIAEPRTAVKRLMSSDAVNLQDLELIQLVSLGDAITFKELQSQKFRLKTFFSGWVAGEAFTEGRVDLIPIRFSMIPRLIESRQIPFDVAIVQISPPNENGYCSLGVSVDVARQVMDQADIVVGEINPAVPQTIGDTYIPLSEFNVLIESRDEPIYFERWPVDEVFERVAANVASVISDGSCLAFSLGPLYEALSKHLKNKRHLGIHTPFITDALMELIESGAVSNRFKETYRGKTLTSYAFGSKRLMQWLDRNPLVEFQTIDKVFHPLQIGQNPRFTAVLPARKVDISGHIALHAGKGTVTAAPGEAVDFINGAELSQGGRTIFALPSRNLKDEANIRISIEEYPNQFSMRESVDMVITEYGVAALRGRTVRERAQALIDIAHPDDRENLVEQAKQHHILYQDQIFLPQSTQLYPNEIATRHTFKNETEVFFRAIKPSDEEGMRRLFYRFSDKTVYYRYFTPIKVMPHTKMQEYVNTDRNRIMAIVGLAGEPGQEQIIAEARFVRDLNRPYADVAFVVDEKYQGLGIASFMYQMLVRLAKETGLKGFTADVLATNKSMMKVFEKGNIPVKATLESGIYELLIDFESTDSSPGIRFSR